MTGRCELCAEPILASHRHLLDRTTRTLCCACGACVILFDGSAAGGRSYRLVPDRRWHLPDLALDEPVWASLRLPVRMAFFFRSTTVDKMVVCYPSPAGAVEAALEPAAWQRIEADNPVLRALEPDVEALLVNRTGSARDHFLVPVDDCYALAGLVRTGWQGFTGGAQVWEAIGAFFRDLRARARPAPALAPALAPAPATGTRTDERGPR